MLLCVDNMIIRLWSKNTLYGLSEISINRDLFLMVYIEGLAICKLEYWENYLCLAKTPQEGIKNGNIEYINIMRKDCSKKITKSKMSTGPPQNITRCYKFITKQKNSKRSKINTALFEIILSSHYTPVVCRHIVRYTDIKIIFTLLWDRFNL